MYNYDGNGILVGPIKNRSEEEFIRVHTEVIEYLRARGRQSTIQRLDNEASENYKNNITNYHMKYELTPAQIHRRNIAERAIQTFKNHFISILAGLHKNFPKNECDLLFPQAEMTMNLLRTSRLNLNLSVYEQMNRTFGYSRIPLAPLGIKILAYEMPSHRGSWEQHGQEGWYIEPATEHYQCYKVLIKSTKGIRTPPKVAFYPERDILPHNSSKDRAIQAAQELTQALLNPAPATPFEHVGDSNLIALKKLANIFQQQA